MLSTSSMVCYPSPVSTGLSYWDYRLLKCVPHFNKTITSIYPGDRTCRAGGSFPKGKRHLFDPMGCVFWPSETRNRLVFNELRAHMQTYFRYPRKYGYSLVMMYGRNAVNLLSYNIHYVKYLFNSLNLNPSPTLL